MSLRSCWAGALALVVALVVGGSTAQAQVVPFKVTGGGPAPDGLSVLGAPSDHTATGTATHLGTYTGSGTAVVLTAPDATGTGTFQGTFTFVAKNGDELVMTYGDTDNGAARVGEYQIVPVDETRVQVVFTAEFNPVVGESTGRFAKVVAGSFLMIATTEPFVLAIDEDGFTPPFDYSWTGKGTLTFARGKK
jgi:hypothetical protein